jgi:hypothetical protein
MEGNWNPVKYIGIDEIKPGMQAYCLSCIKGTQIEKFDLDVLSVVHNIEPGRDAILVQSTDERFIHTGPVAGCSGSPVYIDGRLAGAIAFMWPLSKDPLYGVTPIGDMLRVGQKADEPRGTSNKSRFIAFDFSMPIDFTDINRQIDSQSTNSIQHVTSNFIRLPCPLIVSGVPDEAFSTLSGLDALSGFFGGSTQGGVPLMPISGGGSNAKSKADNVELAPGAVLSIPLITGDITATVIGTATEILDDKVYAFGHGLLEFGPINLPMATGIVHTVVSNLSRSFKLASSLKIVGALTTDQSTAVFGQIGAKPHMIPLTMKVDRYNDTKLRVYNCQIAHNQLLTPSLLRVAVYGAAFYLGSFPPDHMIEYKVAIGIENPDTRGDKEIRFENVSTGSGVAEMISESVGSVALLMNNPFKEVDIKSLDFDIRILPKNIASHIWSVDLSDSEVQPGQEISLAVVVESYLSEKKKYQFSFKIPDQTPPGKYELIVCGSNEYEQFLRKAVPYRFLAQDFGSLITALNGALSIERDKLYCLLVLPPGGFAVERAELPDLPATKLLILQSAKRTLRIQPYPKWLEKSTKTGTIVVDRKVIPITVENSSGLVN